MNSEPRLLSPTTALALLLSCSGLLFSAGANAADAANPVPGCPAVDQDPKATVLRADVEAYPSALGQAFEYADVLTAAACHEAALAVLQRAETFRPDSNALKRRMRQAENTVSESTFFDQRQRAATSARAARERLRCLELGDTHACDIALKAEPGSVPLRVAKGNALLKNNAPARAVSVAASAVKLDPTNTEARKLLDLAHVSRKYQIEKCLQRTSPDAIVACELARIPGDDVDFSLLRRMAQLHEQAGSVEDALDQYSNAHALRRNDPEVAQAIIRLTNSMDRTDARSLTTMGSALLTQGRNSQAKSMLERALAMDPSQLQAKELMSQLAGQPSSGGSTESATRPRVANNAELRLEEQPAFAGRPVYVERKALPPGNPVATVSKAPEPAIPPAQQVTQYSNAVSEEGRSL